MNKKFNDNDSEHIVKDAFSEDRSDCYLAMADMYSEGIEVPQDEEKAFYYTELAAQLGNLIGQFNLGNYYVEGRGCEVDPDMAKLWWKKAALQGLVEAQYNLGLRLLNENNYDEAFKWLKLAAEQGMAEAQYKVAMSYLCGWGVEADHILAKMWAEQSASQGYPEAQFIMGVLCEEDGEMTEADEYYHKAAAQGYQAARKKLGWD